MAWDGDYDDIFDELLIRSTVGRCNELDEDELYLENLGYGRDDAETLEAESDLDWYLEGEDAHRLVFG